MSNIYTIQAGIPFARALASGLLLQYGDKPETLARVTVILPTRRACRALEDALRTLAGNKPILLPKLQTIGNVDEEELSLSIIGHEGIEKLEAIPPAIDPLKRQILLAKLIQKIPGRTDNIAQAMALAKALSHLIDQTYTEGLDLKDLQTLVPSEFAQHWQLTLDFLKILSDHWPSILAAEGAIDPTNRRDKLIRTLSAHWQKHPPQNPIIAAGSTGSIPATAEFLKTVANLPQGKIILPGLDLDMDEDDWNAIEPLHPQAGLQKLITYCDSERKHIQKWPHALNLAEANLIQARQTLAREITRPDSTTAEWTNLKDNPATIATLKTALNNLSLFEADNEQDEANLIALILRETLETKNKTATLITPDRNLARRVIALCKRWNIDIDDSSGSPLSKTPSGILFRLILEAWQNKDDPVRLLALLKHDLCVDPHDPVTHNETLWAIEKHIRTSDEKYTLKSLINHLKASQEDLSQNNQNTLKTLEVIDTHLNGSKSKEFSNINDIIDIHTELRSALSVQDNNKETSNSEALSHTKSIETLLESLSKHSVLFGNISLKDYAEIFTILINLETVRPTFGTHPRLQILGQIEARMTDADTIIMAGLNEKSWPADSQNDPWMSNPMREQFGLPGNDQHISLAAHDFVQGFCNPNIIMTRSQTKARTPTIPARWLQRLTTIARASGLNLAEIKAKPALEWIKQLSPKTETITLSRPKPTPPQSARPTQLSVTQIETWLQDPYSLYARSILKLKKLNPINAENNAATKGIIIHDSLDWFTKEHPRAIPKNAADLLTNEARSIAHNRTNDASLWPFWEPQFHKAFTATVNNETIWRQNAKTLSTEASGQINIESKSSNMTLTARADRIDELIYDPINSNQEGQNTGAIIDYKSGGSFTKKGLENGSHPQLPLEALILERGGFSNIPAIKIGYLGYWYITAGSKSGAKTELKENIDDTVTIVEDKITHLIETYANPDTPYLNIPRPNNLPRFNDYAHLARIQEWSKGESETSEGSE